MRISRHQMFMQMAEVVAKRATCMRLNVGAIMVHNRNVVSIGYNGPPSGYPHCIGNECPGRDGGCKISLHAERNALARLPVDIEGSIDLYTTDSPCAQCFDAIAFDGRVDRIFFSTPYRIIDHLKNPLWDIEVFRITPAGYVIDWNTQRLVEVET